MYPHVKHCSDVRHALTGGHVGSFRSVQWLETLAFRAYWNMSGKEWGCPIGKQLQSHFLLSVFCVCGKTILMFG